MTRPRWLVDTDVVSETSRRRPAAPVIEWLHREPVVIAATTVYELALGVETLAEGKRKAFLAGWLSRLMASVEVVAFDRDAALAAARIQRDARRRGRSIDTHDLMILACASACGFTVATRSVAHFEGHGIVVFDPFTGTFART